MYEIKSFGKASFKSLPKFLLPVLSRDPLLPSLKKEKARSTHGFAAILWVKRKMALEGPSCYIDVTGGLDRWCCTSKTFSPSQSGGCGWLWMIEDESSNGRMGTKKTMILQRHTFFYLFFFTRIHSLFAIAVACPYSPFAPNSKKFCYSERVVILAVCIPHQGEAILWNKLPGQPNGFLCVVNV